MLNNQIKRPHCGSSNFIKNDHDKFKNQMFFCKDCKRCFKLTFTKKHKLFSLFLTLVVFIATIPWKFTKSTVISFASDAESAISKLLFLFLFLNLFLFLSNLSNSSVFLSISSSKLSSCTSNTTFLFVLLKLA